MTKHTPTPWSAEVDQSDNYARKNERRWIIPGVSSSVFSGANARYIIHCVNTHDQLVAALEDARKQLEWYHGELFGEDYNDTKINAAIAAAKEPT